MRASNVIYQGSGKKRVQRPRAITPIREIPTKEIARKASSKLYHALPPEAIYAAIKDGTIETMADYNSREKNPKTNTRLKDHKAVSFSLPRHHPDLDMIRQETKRILDWLHQAAQDRMALIEFLQEREEAHREKRSFEQDPPEPRSSKKIPTFDLVLLASPEEWVSALKVLYIQEKQTGGGFRFTAHAVEISKHAASERHAQAMAGQMVASKAKEERNKAKAQAKVQEPPEEPQQPQEPQAIPREKLPAKSKMMQRPGVQ